MRNQETKTELGRAFPHPKDKITAAHELSDAELVHVAGGLNPQPLPPRVIPRY
jgi:hypothetical protein